MILRDVILSDQRRMLGVVPPERVPLVIDTPADREDAQFGADAHADRRHEAHPAIELRPIEEQPATVREHRLSLESVAAWLAVQDNETRCACAAVLADDLIQVHEVAKAEGVAAGRTQAEREGEREFQRVQTMLQSLVTSAEAAFEQEQLRLAEQCTDIVAEAFAKIAGTQLLRREAVSGVIAEILKRVKEGRELTVRVCAADLPVLRQEEAQLASVLAGRKFSLVADARVDLGGCIVESNQGSLDGRLEVQLRELYETLRSAKSMQMDAP